MYRYKYALSALLACLTLNKSWASNSTTVTNNAPIGNYNMTGGESDGCNSLESGPDADATINKVTFKWVWRVSVAHTGLEFETSKGKFALAYNSKSVPGPNSTPGMVWCQSGGMPMKNALANGDCSDCGGWQSGGSSSKNMKSLGEFMKDVKKYVDDHPLYNIYACQDGAHNQANCQSTANHLFKELTGEYPDKGACPECPSICNR